MTATERTAGATSVWWGEHALDPGRVLAARIGPLSLSIRRLAREWRIAHRRLVRGVDESEQVKLELSPSQLAEPDGVERFLVRETRPRIHLAPALADRPVVSRPEHPFHVPTGEATTLFVSSPIWVRVAEGEEHRLLTELPVVVPSDTWFGPSTREGDLCYASRTSGRLELEDVPLRPHRAVTAVTIENRGAGALRVDRLKLPVTQLSVYAGPRGFLWTEAVTLVREEDGELARLHLDHGPSGPARDGERLSGPREPRVEAGLFHAFTSLFD